MTDRSTFTEAQWWLLTRSPHLVSAAAFVAQGKSGTWTVWKEVSASEKAITKPGDRGAATVLITQIAAASQEKAALDAVAEYRSDSVDHALAGIMHDIEAAAEIVHTLPAEEATHIGNWFVDIARAVAKAAKGVSPAEQQMVDTIATIFGVAAAPIE